MSHLKAVPDDVDPINEENPDWSDKIRMLIRDKKAPDHIGDAPEWLKEIYPQIPNLLKSVWELGYLAALGDATNIIDEEEVNIAMTVLNEWAESKND